MARWWLCAMGTGCATVGGGVQKDLSDGPSSFRRLWVPHFAEGELRAWFASGLSSDRGEEPDLRLRLPEGTAPNALAFDAEGDLWLTDLEGARLLEMDADTLQDDEPAPATALESDGASLRDPIGLVWDEDGGLWVACIGQLEHFAPEVLAESGPVTPDRVLTAGFDLPAGLVWDGQGDLWVTDASFYEAPERNAVKVFTPEQLAQAGPQQPQLELRHPDFSLVEGLAFDTSGDLWVSSSVGRAVVRLDSQDLELPEQPEVREVEDAGMLLADEHDSASGRAVGAPGGLLFDPDGHLFVNAQRGEPHGEGSSVLRFGPAQLSKVNEPLALQAEVVLSDATSNPGFGGLALQR